MSNATQNKIENENANVEAWVVFTGQTDLPWLKMLKPGFRHCFVLINDGQHWVSLDPMLHHTDLQVHNVPADFDLPRWLRCRGHRVVKAPVNRAQAKPAPVMVFTCVEAVKRVLGLHAWNVVTPWQLYRRLSRVEIQSTPLKTGFEFGGLAWAA